jgi:hypothetical protein
MGPSLVVVADVLGDDAVEVSVVEHKDVVEALAAQRSKEALREAFVACAPEPERPVPFPRLDPMEPSR